MKALTLSSGKLTISVRFHPQDGLYSARVFSRDNPEVNNEFRTFPLTPGPNIFGALDIFKSRNTGTCSDMVRAARMALNLIQDAEILQHAEMGPFGWELELLDLH